MAEKHKGVTVFYFRRSKTGRVNKQATATYILNRKILNYEKKRRKVRRKLKKLGLTVMYGDCGSERPIMRPNALDIREERRNITLIFKTV